MSLPSHNCTEIRTSAGEFDSQMDFECFVKIVPLKVNLSHLYPSVILDTDSELPIQTINFNSYTTPQAVFDPSPAQSTNPYKCDKCSYSCTHLSRFNEHLTVHSHVRPYNCETCSSSFKLMRYLCRHRKTCSGIHAPRNEEVLAVLGTDGDAVPSIKPYTCRICGNSFRLKKYLKDHERRTRCATSIADLNATGTLHPWLAGQSEDIDSMAEYILAKLT